jgi:hypothetical protein
MYTAMALPASIQKALKTEGINICGRTVSNIIADERYIGKFYINKRTTKLGTGRTKSKRIKLPKGTMGTLRTPGSSDCGYRPL